MASLASDMAKASIMEKESGEKPPTDAPAETAEAGSATAGKDASASASARANADGKAETSAVAGSADKKGSSTSAERNGQAAAKGSGGGGGSSSSSSSSSSSKGSIKKGKKQSVVIKIGMVGEAQTGKTSLMVKYVEGKFDEDYIQTLGVNFMEKTITLKNTEITFSIWDLGGQMEFASMLPLVCNDAVVVLFVFDLSDRSMTSLKEIKNWYKKVRQINKNAFAFLIGTKYDLFVKLPAKEQADITKLARKYAKAMKAPLIFSSAQEAIGVQKIFKIVLSKVFQLKCNIAKISNVGEPILEY
jgi:GTP-binding protein of the ras superfamily involved in termination of M-phase